MRMQAVTVTNNSQSSLMLLTSKKEVYPLNTSALSVSQATKKETAEYINALIIFRNGDIKKVERIEKLGLYGDSLISKAKSALFGVYSVIVDLVEVKYSFVELKDMITVYFKAAEMDDLWYETEDQQSRVLDSLDRATNINDIFEAISLPALEDCLDVL